MNSLTEDLFDALMVALPFVEDALDDDGYKPGAVKAALKKLHAVLDLAEYQFNLEKQTPFEAPDTF